MRQLAAVVPLLAHYFHLRPDDIVTMPPYLLNAYLAALPRKEQ